MRPLPFLPTRPGMGYVWAAPQPPAPQPAAPQPAMPGGEAPARQVRRPGASTASLPAESSCSALWAEPSPDLLRRRALHAAWLERGGPELLAGRPVLHEVTLLDGSALDGEGLNGVVEALAALPDPPLLRIELDWTADAPLPDWPHDAPHLGGLPIFLHGQLHHPDDLTPQRIAALEALAERGVPLAAEVFLLRGVNDEVDVLRELLLRLLESRVRPYYLVDGEWLPPGLRVPPERALDLVRGLRGWISGLAVPQWIRESAAGERFAVVPDYIEEAGAEEVRLRNYRGEPHIYRNPRPPAGRS